jgi:hypothetical protein
MARSFILGIAVFCSISITTAASRCTWAFARDRAIPFYSFWAKVTPDQTPMNALILLTLVQMLLGLIDLGNSTAFTAFASVGTIALAAGYAIPIAVSMFEGRKSVSSARFHVPGIIGWTLNILAVLWVIFEAILFSMPVALPVTLTTMNWASLVFAGFMFLSIVYYVIFARKSEPFRPQKRHTLANAWQITPALPNPMGYDIQLAIPLAETLIRRCFAVVNGRDSHFFDEYVESTVSSSFGLYPGHSAQESI